MVAEPFALAAGVNVSVPAGETAGGVENSDGFVLFVTLNVTVWNDSFGPGEIPVAHPETLWAPASSSTVTFAPAVNDGA